MDPALELFLLHSEVTRPLLWGASLFILAVGFTFFQRITTGTSTTSTTFWLVFGGVGALSALAHVFFSDDYYPHFVIAIGTGIKTGIFTAGSQFLVLWAFDIRCKTAFVLATIPTFLLAVKLFESPLVTLLTR